MKALDVLARRVQWIRAITLITFVALVQFSANAQEEPAKEEAEQEESQGEAPVTLASILDSKPDPKDYAKRTHCISKVAIRDHEVLSKRHIVFTMRGEKREKMLIQFGRHCFGLHRKAILNLESRGSSRLCIGDYVRTEVFEFGRRSWGPRCTIPKFEPISDYQLALLRDALHTGRVE